MGEYARLYTLEHFGVDIGDDDERPRPPKKPVPEKRFGCSCGRAFVSDEARGQHQKDTGHAPSKRAAKEQQ